MTFIRPLQYKHTYPQNIDRKIANSIQTHNYYQHFHHLKYLKKIQVLIILLDEKDCKRNLKISEFRCTTVHL